jgi:integrase
MSSINFHKKKNGKVVYRLRFKVDGKICRISVGSKLPQKVERKLLNLIDRLEAHNASGTQLDAELMEEVRNLDDALRQKLVASGLVGADSVLSLKTFLENYISRKKDVSEHTLYKLNNTKRLFLSFFGNLPLNAITAGDVEDYIEQRKSDGRSAATIAAEIKHGKQFFGYAVRKKLLAENPFEDFKVGSQVDQTRNTILDPNMLEQVIDSLPTLEWRALISVIRWTGCRQSEALVLRWSDVLWDQNRIVMPSPKTAKQGKPSRTVPLFPELLPVLREWSENSPDGSEYVISNLVSGSNRSGRQGRNLRKPFQKFISLAGFDPWPKPFQNLRSTRENELERFNPSHVVQDWIGHSRKTAEDHYLRVSDADFDRAMGWSHSGQQGPAAPCIPSPENLSALKKPLLQVAAEICRTTRRGQTPPLGLEPRT